MNAIDGVIYLARCAVNEIVPDKEIVGSLDLDSVYQEASRHMITVAVGMSLIDSMDGRVYGNSVFNVDCNRYGVTMSVNNIRKSYQTE